jgi:hypothetical protein
MMKKIRLEDVVKRAREIDRSTKSYGPKKHSPSKSINHNLYHPPLRSQSRLNAKARKMKTSSSYGQVY